MAAVSTLGAAHTFDPDSTLMGGITTSARITDIDSLHKCHLLALHSDTAEILGRWGLLSRATVDEVKGLESWFRDDAMYHTFKCVCQIATESKPVISRSLT